MERRDDGAHFGAKLRAARLRAGWTQQELAGRSGLDRATISLIENGRESPRADTVQRLAAVLGLHPGELWQGGGAAGGGEVAERTGEGLGKRRSGEGRLREVPELEYEPVQQGRLHPGLEELLEDERMRLMLGITEEEEAMLRSIRTRREAPLGRDFFLDVLISYRRHHSG